MNRLRILVAHAKYRQLGGEDIVAEQEAELLEKHGHTVERYTQDNRDIDVNRRLTTALQTIWSTKTTADLSRLINNFKPDIVHVHNTFPSLSPSLYWTAARCAIPVVQTLHNFRLLCPQAMLLRNGAVCEDCVGHVPWRAVVRGCYRDSSAHSAVLAGMLVVHRSLGTYRHKVTRYIALNEFCRRKFVAGGLAADKIAVKPNCADIPKPNLWAPRRGALFVGRVSKEKGIDLVNKALDLMPSRSIEVIGDGPERDAVVARANIVFRGWLKQPDLLDAMRRSAYLVLPSIWYENSPRTLIEAFGCGLPVIASNIGALAELVDHGRTGLLFDPSDPANLANAMCWADDHPDEMRVMGHHARREFELHFSPDKNCARLLEIYRDAIQALHSEEAA